ncbi:hypothetical protein IW147_001810 [Coemansia sp. RSA 720]|nr:hypothetical protein IW147_001810 [Coemansia sp. RSA 720]KAJ2541754.1 hypothetical protein GGF49_003400 [Coemansia sp. RSA 1853]
MSDGNRGGEPDTKRSAERQQFLNELEALQRLDTTNESLESQYDGMTEIEQKRMVEKLTIENEADIRTFSMFLKLPTVCLLMLNLVFAYNYAVSGFGGPKLPFTSIRLYADHPMVATEISVVILQFTIYLLSSGRWDWITKGGVTLLLVAGVGCPLASNWNGVVEVVWWMLPALNLAIVSFAQLNMRRSRGDIEKLAARVNHDKNE